jgi:hypothetical protein
MADMSIGALAPFHTTPIGSLTTAEIDTTMRFAQAELTR